MLLIIFGAGASFDAVDPDVAYFSRKFQPPLASDLFGKRSDFNSFANSVPQVKNIIQVLRQAAAEKKDVEDELERLSTRPRLDQRARELLGLRFYIHHVMVECSNWAPDDWTNYRAMAYALDSWQAEVDDRSRDVLIVTFNYDRLLERGFGAVYGRTFESFGHYTNSPGVQIVKLHGSIGWGREVARRWAFRGETPSVAAFLNNATRADLDLRPDVRDDYPNDDSLKLVDVRESRSAASGELREVEATLVVPAIAVPTRAKLEFECPSSQVRLMEQLLPAVSKVLMIGWRGGEEPFLHSLATLNAVPRQYVAVGGSDKGIDTLKRRLATAGVCSTSDVEGDPTGFSAYMRNGRFEEFLRS